MKKLLLFVGCLFAGSIFTKEKRTFEQVQKEYQGYVDVFNELEWQGALVDGSSMQAFFLLINLPSNRLIPELRADVKVVKKACKKEKSQWCTVFYKSLNDMYEFIRRHRLNNDIVVFHQSLKDRWGMFLDAFNRGQDVVELLLSNGKLDDQLSHASFKRLLKEIMIDQRKISEYEDRLHADWIDLKLTNYVAKINMLRLHNGIFYHPAYKGKNLKTSYPR